MNSSTLPPLLRKYLPSYEQQQTVTSTRSISEQFEHVMTGSNEVENSGEKSKHLKTVMTHKRLIEAEEKALKEREEKALHTLKMWNIVKENERKRKYRMLKDRVKLQHEMIKKQDELMQEKRQEELKKQISAARSQKPNVLVGMSQKVEQKDNYASKTKAIDTKTQKLQADCKTASEEALQTTCEEEKHPETFILNDVFSEEDMSELLEKSVMEEADFHELRYQPLQVQLERLFGDDADEYLNPTVKESPRKGFDLSLARKKGQHGAAALWETLRAFSRQKLMNKDALILPDVKNAYACFVRECLRRHVTPVKRNFVNEEETPPSVNLDESDILKDVRYRRHRQELMFRIAHVNKDKTKLLFQVIGPPHYSEIGDENGIRRYCPAITQEENEKKTALIKLPEIHEKSSIGNIVTARNTQAVKPKHKEQQVDTQPHVAGSKLVFLTEKKATCKGQFAKRLNKEDKEESNLKHSQSADALLEKKTPSPMFTERRWEPLSMEALLEQNVAVVERHTEISVLDSSKVWNVCT